MEPVFEVDAGAVNGEVLVRFVGELDIAAIGDAHDGVVGVLDQNPNGPLIVDLEGLTFCDSSGIRELLVLQRLANARGREMVLRHVLPNVTRVLEVVGLSDAFTIEE